MSTRENVEKWTRYFLLFFSDASERRVWLSAESKILASTFGRFCLYRFRVIVSSTCEKFWNIFETLRQHLIRNFCARQIRHLRVTFPIERLRVRIPFTYNIFKIYNMIYFSLSLYTSWFVLNLFIDIIMNLITEHNYGERIPVSKNGKEDHLMEKENCFNLNIFIQLLIRYDISRKQI